jgi:hypothetical protein
VQIKRRTTKRQKRVRKKTRVRRGGLLCRISGVMAQSSVEEFTLSVLIGFVESGMG